MALRKPYIGQMDRKIKILKVVNSKDRVGQEKSIIEVYSEPWAKLHSDIGSEDIDMAVMSSVGRIYIIRWRSDIERDGFKMLVEDCGVRYNVVSVSQLGRRSHLVLKCVNEQ